MSLVEIKVLHTPQIFLNHTPILFPYKKAEALFYFLALEKSATRDEVAALLWDDEAEAVAKKNLRHAIYVVKKTFGLDIIISPQKYTLVLNPDISFTCDVDRLLQEKRFDLYQGSLLQGFGVKNAYAYEDWLSKKREFIRETYLNELYKYIVLLPPSRLSEIELCCGQYMLQDPVDERISLFLMSAYKENKLYHKGIKVYQKLSETLSEELGIAPGKDVTRLYRFLLNEWTLAASDTPENPEPFFIGRQKELSKMQEAYQAFLFNQSSSLIVTGENGVGKSYLAKVFLETADTSGVLLLKTNCFQAEKDFSLQPLNSVMLQLDEYINTHQISIPVPYSQAAAQFFPTFLGINPLASSLSLHVTDTFSYRAAKNGILRIFQLVAKHTRLVLFIDNIHWMDATSLDLLSTLMREGHNRIMLLCTSLDTLDTKLEAFTSSLLKEGLLQRIALYRFTAAEVSSFASAMLSDNTLTAETLELIFNETQGNAFFLMELLANFKDHGLSGPLSLRTQDILADRLSGLSLDARKVLDVMALFHNHSALHVIEAIFHKSTFDLLDKLEDLKLHALIAEYGEGDKIYFEFIHNKMREFVRDRLSPSKRRILHNRIGDILESLMSPLTENGYKLLIYHYTLGANLMKVLRYKVLSLDEYSSLTYELYPILSSQVDANVLPALSIMTYFNQLEQDLLSLKNQFSSSQELDELRAIFWHSKGRYCIHEGLYELGQDTITRLLACDFVQKSPAYQLKAHRQMIYLGIQLYDTVLMSKHIQYGLKLSRKSEDHIEYAFYMRLSGLHALMLGDYEKSILFLNQSVDYLKKTILNEQIYVLNIAASYNYLGEVSRHQLQFDQALRYYKQAIALCTMHNCPPSAVFYTNYARVLLALNETQKARENFMLADSLYDNSNTLMGRSIAKGYCAVFHAQSGHFEKAKTAILESVAAAHKLNSPLELGLLRRSQAELSFYFQEELSDVLDKPLQWYCKDCTFLLSGLPNIYELKDLVFYSQKKNP